MKKRDDWWKALAGLAVLAVLAVGLGLLFRGQRPTPVATEPTATATAQPAVTQEVAATPTTMIVPTGTAPASTPVPGLVPTEVAPPEPTTSLPGLDDYLFGEPQVVLTNTNPIKVVEWLPDNRRLLLELGTGDPVLHNRIVTLDVETGEVVEYGRRPELDIKPVWVEKYQGVVYSFLKLTEASELRFGRPGGQPIILDTDYFPVTMDPKTGRIFYLKPTVSGNPLRAVEPTSGAMPIIPFDTISLPVGIPLIDPTGERLAILRRNDLPVLDLKQGQVYTYDFDSLAPAPWWAKDGAWSPDGRTLAFMLVLSENLLDIESRLAILDVESGRLYSLDLPMQYIDELDWAPSGQHLLVTGADLEEGDHVNTLWLVDPITGKYLQPQLLPPHAMLVPEWSVAWSCDGRWLALFGGVPGANAVFVSEVTVNR